MNKFNLLIEKYHELLEADEQMAGDQTAPDMADQTSQPPQPDLQQQPQPVQTEPASSTFTYLTKIVFEAFKTKDILNKGDIKFSDNQARNKDEAFKYFDIILRNLQQQTRTKIEQGFESEGDVNDIDEGNIVDMANLAIKALFYAPKDNSTEYQDISMETEVTPENAKRIYNTLSRFLVTS